MAVTLKGALPTYVGTSQDDKPTEADVNTLFEELDTGDTYYYTGETWLKVGPQAAEGGADA